MLQSPLSALTIKNLPLLNNQKPDYQYINSNKKAIIGIDEAIRVLELATEIEEKLHL